MTDLREKLIQRFTAIFYKDKERLNYTQIARAEQGASDALDLFLQAVPEKRNIDGHYSVWGEGYDACRDEMIRNIKGES